MIMVPPLTEQEGSWVIIDRQTGEAVLELFRDSVAVHRLNLAKYAVVPILAYLQGLNHRIISGV